MTELRIPLLILALSAALAGCSALPDKPVRQTMYDFGPIPPAAAAASSPSGAALVLPDVEAKGALETQSMVYRLGYEDPHQMRPYAYARWSAKPGELFWHRLRETLAHDRPVLDSSAAAALARRGTAAPLALRVELQEFSQYFLSATDSRGIVRVRCTLLENTGAGQRLVAQRSFGVERPAPTADAPGGVRALAAATDAVAQEIGAWLQQPH